MIPRNTGIRIGGNDSNRLIVLPRRDGQILQLACLALTSLLEPLLHQCGGIPLQSDLSATAIESILVQIREVYIKEIVVEALVSMGALQMLGDVFDNFCSQISLNSVSLFSCVDLESRHIPASVLAYTP